MENFYKTLEIPEAASQDEIKKSYRRLAILHHPDKNNGSKQSEELFKRIKHAYDVLIDPSSRKRHDDDLAAFRREEAARNQERATRETASQSAPYANPEYASQSNGWSWAGFFAGLAAVALLFFVIAALVEKPSPKLK